MARRRRRRIKKKGYLHSIPTEYRGIMMRSQSEARFAQTLDSLGLEWVYEPLTMNYRGKYYLRGYIPDFLVPSMGVLFEVKGWLSPWASSKLARVETFNKVTIVVITDEFYRR